jgi:transcription antitermination factor NusB
MGSRRLSREVAMHILYAIDVCKFSKEDAWESFKNKNDELIDEKILEFSNILVDGVVANIEDIDKNISDAAKNWDIHRMASIDRTILRLATYELLYLKEIPVNVIINEAVEIVKDYSTDDSKKFVNGVLDKIKLNRK